jgi:myosin heavy subunit
MLSGDEHDDSSSIGWISLSDLLMVGLVVLLVTVVGESAARKRAEQSSRSFEQKSEEYEERVAKIDAAIAEKAELQAELQRLQLERAALQKKIESYDKLLQSLTKTEAELAEARKQLRDVELKLGELLTELDTARRDLLRARDQLADSEKKLAEAERRLLDLQKYVAELKIPTPKQIAAWEQMEKDYASQKEQIARLRAELAQSRMESMRLTSVVADLEAELKKFSNEQITAEVREQGFRQELLGIRTRESGLGRVVFVVDCSGSMVRSSNSSAESRWDYTQTVIRNWLLLLPFQEVQLVMFNNEVNVYPRDGDFISLQQTAVSRRVDIQPLLDVLKETVPNDGTNTFLALRTAYEARNVDAIFLFTDGQPMLKPEAETTSEDFRIMQNEVLDLIVSENQKGNPTPINVIGLGDYFSDRLSGRNQKHLPFGVFLTRIAQLSGGTFLGR